MYEYDYLNAALNISYMYMIFSYGFLPKVEDYLRFIYTLNSISLHLFNCSQPES